MMDKKAKFVPMGIVTGFFDENQSDASAIDKVLNRSVQLLYNKSWVFICNMIYRKMLLSFLYKNRLVALVEDEALRVKTW